MDEHLFSARKKNTLRSLVMALAEDVGAEGGLVELPKGKTRFNDGSRVLLFEELFDRPVSRFRMIGDGALRWWAAEVELSKVRTCAVQITFATCRKGKAVGDLKLHAAARIRSLPGKRDEFFACAASAA
jgi:hypothetical protein